MVLNTFYTFPVSAAASLANQALTVAYFNQRLSTAHSKYALLTFLTLKAKKTEKA